MYFQAALSRQISLVHFIHTKRGSIIQIHFKDFKVGLVVCFDPAQHSDDPEGVGASCSDFFRS